MNANFDDLFTRVNELDTTVTGLQTGANPVYGNESGAGNDSMYIDASGNVGIGTTSPTSKLHLTYAGKIAWLGTPISQLVKRVRPPLIL